MTIQDNPALFASSSDAASTVAASSQQTSTVVTVPAESDAEMASRLQIQYAIAVDIPSDMNKTKQQFPSEHSSQNYITTSSRNEAVATATNTYALPAGHSHTNLPGVYAIPIQYGTSDGVPCSCAFGRIDFIVEDSGHFKRDENPCINRWFLSYDRRDAVAYLFYLYLGSILRVHWIETLPSEFY